MGVIAQMSGENYVAQKATENYITQKTTEIYIAQKATENYIARRREYLAQKATSVQKKNDNMIAYRAS